MLTERRGFFSWATAASGTILLGDCPGTNGPGIDTIYAFFSTGGFTPYAGVVLEVVPGEGFASGADANGDISKLCAFFVVFADPQTYTDYSTLCPNQNGFADGPEQQEWACYVFTTEPEVEPVEMYFQISSLDPNDPADFDGPVLPDAPHTVAFSDIVADPEEQEGSATVSWEFDGDLDDIDGFIVEYSDDEITYYADSTVPKTELTSKTFTFNIPSTYCIRVRTFKYDTGDGNSLGVPSACEDIVFPDENLLEMEMSGGIEFSGGATFEGFPLDIIMGEDQIGTAGIDLGGTAEVIMMGDPSGLYALVLNKTNDTLYERIGSEDTEDVEIPRPFGRTGFIA